MTMLALWTSALMGVVDTTSSPSVIIAQQQAAATGTGPSGSGSRLARNEPSIVLELNPWEYVIGHFGLSVEALVTDHHAVFVNPALLRGQTLQKTNGGEIEAGWRYFFRREQARGPFVDLALTYSSFEYNLEPGLCARDPSCVSRASGKSVQFAIDAGYRWFWDPFVLTLGGGLFYEKSFLGGAVSRSSDGIPAYEAMYYDVGYPLPRIVLQFGFGG
jgi:hypothetical protein